jgi:hypothetical protein
MIITPIYTRYKITRGKGKTLEKVMIDYYSKDKYEVNIIRLLPLSNLVDEALKQLNK